MAVPDTEGSAAINRWLITLSVMIPTLIEVLDTSVANVALTHIQGSLSAGQEEVTWVLTSYLVANAVIIPMSGWLARLMGRKTYLLTSLGVFTASSLLCGAAASLPQLVIFRILQGLGGGGLQPMSQAILMETFPVRQRGLAMSIYGMGVVLGPILGPLMGGWLTDNWSWRWIFYINLPIGILAFLMIGAFVHDPVYLQRRERGESVDWLGILLLVVGIGCLQFVLDTGQQDDWFNSEHIFLLCVASALALIAFVWRELSCARPVLNLRIFLNRSFALGNMFIFFGFFAFFGSIVLLPMYLQGLMGYTAYLSGLVLGPGGAVMLFTMPVVGKLTERVDARLLLGFGLAVNAYALWSMSGFNLQIDFGTAVSARLVQGVAIPFFFVSLSYLTFAGVPREEMNNASSIYNLLRNLGGSFGVAFVTTVLARRAQLHQAQLVESLNPFDTAYAFASQRLQELLTLRLGSFEDLSLRADAIIHGQLIRQATTIAFSDVFHLQALLFVGLLCLLFLLKKPPVGGRRPSADH